MYVSRVALFALLVFVLAAFAFVIVVPPFKKQQSAVVPAPTPTTTPAVVGNVFDPYTIRPGEVVGAFTSTKLTMYAPYSGNLAQDYEIEFIGSDIVTGRLKVNEMCGPYVEMTIPADAKLPLPRGEQIPTGAFLDVHSVFGEQAELLNPTSKKNLYDKAVEMTISGYRIEHVSRDCGGPYLLINSIHAFAQ